jgi:ADP-heptose:LPS heptosyltransferase
LSYDKIPGNELEQINTICVICWGLIGDVFIRISLLEALKQRFPHTNLTVIVDPGSAVALENHPDVDEVIKLSRRKKPLFSYLKNTFSNLIRLRRRHFDLSIDLYCGGSSIFVTRFVNARLRICFNHRKSLRKANNYLVDTPSFCDNWTMALSCMLLPLGIEKIRRGTSYYCNNQSLEFADEWLADKPEKKLVINLGAGAENKLWATSNYVRLAEIIQKNHAIHAVILTNPGLEYLVEEFVRQAKDKVKFSVLPETSFANVAAVISKVGLIITGDTSIMHLAFGLKCPTLGIFTRTRPEIVDPEDCLHVACFEEGNEKDSCDKYFGTQELTPETCYAQFEQLLLRME